MARHGQRLILGMLAIAVVAAGGAWWYQYQQGQRVLALWGADNAFRIRLAPDCDLLKLRPAETPGAEQISIAGQHRAITSIHPIGHAQGFVHARQALIVDASYDWEAETQVPADWQYALRFRDGQGATILAFDLEQALVVDIDHPDRRAKIPSMSSGLRRFFAEQRP